MPWISIMARLHVSRVKGSEERLMFSKAQRPFRCLKRRGRSGQSVQEVPRWAVFSVNQCRCQNSATLAANASSANQCQEKRSETVPNPGHGYSPGWPLRNAKPSLCDVKVAGRIFYLSGWCVVPGAD